MHKRMKLTRWLLLAVAAVTLALGFASQHPVQAQSNKWVNDHTNTLSKQTMQRIYDINEQDFAKVTGNPQLMVEVYNKIPDRDDVDDFKVDRFQDLGVGRKGWDNGMYFVIALKQHKYGLEVGYGLESIVPDASKSSIITDHIKAVLRAGHYDLGVREISNNIARTVNKNQSAIMTPGDIAAKHAADQRMLATIGIVVAIIAGVIIIWLAWLVLRHVHRQREFDRLLRSDVDWPASMTLINSLPESEQDKFQTRIKAPWFGKSNPELVYRKEFAEYVWNNLAVLVDRTHTPSPYPAYVYDSVPTGYGLAIPTGTISDAAAQKPKRKRLTVDDVNNMPNLSAFIARLDAKSKFEPYTMYQAAFEKWAADNKIVMPEQAYVWREFITNVSEDDQAELATAKAQTAVFAAILYHKHHPNENQTNNLLALPIWVAGNYGGGSQGGGFGSGGGGGMSGGGGFSGGW
ncbi:TPM domain-containing protein [Lacticaseibacillus pabuli]|uniref:TPM domain-containing protein n=1 Tax=Lacticaseibacillus pabuli TaxID=3025672 RepID=A0ABY7WQH0_9LACO|nr:TPM domain-containing protein [Lacticaseibacillus sp. KACC 23028]WDF82438.1 TPM domain-containing protein [Lacticaseibacillus sp. KACC 23028]